MKPTRIYSFIGLIIAAMVFISFDIFPSNFVNAEPVSVTITLSVNNSCIVNNANVAIRNDNNTPIDATNNWWGMPIGPTDFTTETFAGDSVKGAVSYIPFQTLILPRCALSGTDWIPFTEQDVQTAIQTELPNLRGIGFALVDFQVGIGAKFTFVTTPAYGSLQSEATIRMVPSTDGNFVTWVLDTNLPTNATLRQIATCELMPLFINSLQQVKTRLTLPSQEMAQMVVMDDALRLRFSQPTEITPEPAPALTMTYDTSCLPAPTAMQEQVVWGKPYAPQSEPVSQPAPTPMMISDMRSEPASVMGQFNCNGEEPIGFECLLEIGDVITYVDENNLGRFKIINRTATEFIQPDFPYPVNEDLQNGIFPRRGALWGIVGTNHYRIAYSCGLTYSTTGQVCFTDLKPGDISHYHVPYLNHGAYTLSPRGTKIAGGANTLYLYNINMDNTLTGISSIQRTKLPRWTLEDNIGLFYIYVNANYPVVTYNALMRYQNTNIFPSNNNELTINSYDVYLNDILYTKKVGNRYELWRYRNSTKTKILESPYVLQVQWSPRGDKFLLTEVNTSLSANNYCITVYNISDLSSKDVACGNFSGGVDWAGTSPLTNNIGIDLSFMPHDIITPTPTPTPTLTPTPTPTTTPPVECPTPSANLAGTMSMSTTLGDVPIECQEPPPSEECLAQTVGGATIRFSPYDINKTPEDQDPDQPNLIIVKHLFDGDIALRPSANVSVIVLGRNTGFELDENWWWYVEIRLENDNLKIPLRDDQTQTLNDADFVNYPRNNGNPITSIKGWVVSYAIEKELDGCDIYNLERVPIRKYVTDNETEVIPYNPVYDYPLELPQPPWYTANDWDTKSMEGKFDTWRTEGATHLWEKSTTSIRDYICTAETATIHNCALIVYVVFYELFYRIYGPERPLMLSDILAVTYPIELGPASIWDANMAKQALSTYYFYQVGDYCNRRPDTCNEETLQMPIEHFVYQYIHGSSTALGFLPPLNAWYHYGTFIANWYFDTPKVDISLIENLGSIPNGPDELGAIRLRNLLAYTDISDNSSLITFGRFMLNEPRPRFSNLISLDGPITWGNFPYPGPLAGNTGTDFWVVVMAPMPPEPGSEVKICVLNQSYDEDDIQPWKLDAFAIVLSNRNTGFGADGAIPPWAGSPNNNTNKSCLCSETYVINGCP